MILLHSQTRAGPEVEHLSQYIQLVLESLYIFTGLKTLFALHFVIHRCVCKSYNNSVYDSLTGRRSA